MDEMKRLFALLFVSVFISAASVAESIPSRPASGFEQTDLSSGPVISVTRQGVAVQNPGDETIEVKIFAITGILASHSRLEPGQTVEIELKAGYYIVRAGDVAKRVVVR